MAGQAEQRFESLKSEQDVLALIGSPEDTYLDCKRWPSRDEDLQKMLAKAVCAMANADGGVLVIGMKTENRNEEPDLITDPAPVDDAAAVASRVLNLVPQIIEPGVSGVEAEPILAADGRSGFVKVLVPRNQGPPHRSRKDWKFYQRIASSALAMDYWQIEERFSLRANPRLELRLEERGFARGGMLSLPYRNFMVGIGNSGLGLGRFPALRFATACGLLVSDFGLDGNCGFGLPRQASEQGVVLFQGGVDHVVYPGDTLLIAVLVQEPLKQSPSEIALNHGAVTRGQLIRRSFSKVTFSFELFCEGAPVVRENVAIPATIGEFDC